MKKASRKNQLRKFTKKNWDRQPTEATNVNDTNNDLETSTLESAQQQHILDPQNLKLEKKKIKQPKLIDALTKRVDYPEVEVIQ